MPQNTQTSIRRRRFQHRLLAHHVPLLVLSAASVWVFSLIRPLPDLISRITFATAYPALVLLVITLVIGPWNVLLKRRNPVSSDLRRDIAIWAGVLSILHAGIGQCMHLRGRPWLYYIYGANEHHSFPMRHDLFGFSNYTGALSVLLVIALLAMSNDFSLRALGTPRWKQLQRWNYAAFALAAAHTIGYQIPQKGSLAFHWTARICIAITIAMQTAGYLKRRASAGKSDGLGAGKPVSGRSSLSMAESDEDLARQHHPA